MALRRLFTAQAADGNSAAFKAKELAGAADWEKILLQGYGTWSGVTLHIEVCADPSASPQVWDPVMQSDMSTAVTFTSDFVVNLELPSGAAVRGRVSGAGSPVPSLTLLARGDLDAA